MTRGLLMDRFYRWLLKGEYKHVERRMLQVLLIATLLLVLSGFVRAIVSAIVQTD